MTDWRDTTIGELCEDIFDGPHATPAPSTDGPVFLGIDRLDNGRLDLTEIRNIAEQDFPRWTKRVLPREDDIVFSYETRLGQAALIPAGLRCCLGRRMGLLRVNRTKADPHFLLYAYLGPDFQEVIQQRTIHGSTVERIALTELPNFPIRVPDLSIQKKIGGLLKGIDEKIDLNRKTAHVLEEMAQALFKSWFVDFDPVVAKSEGRKPFGISDEVAALFPDSFEESELGPIPKGWKVSNLIKLVEVVDCLHSKKPVRQETATGICLQLNNIRDDGLLDLSDVYRISDSDYQLWTKRIEVREGDCIITNVGRVGAVARIPPAIKAAIGRNITAIRLREEIDLPFFLIILLLSSVMRTEIELRTDTGTILDALNVKSVPHLRFVDPGSGILSEFEKIASPMWKKKESCFAETRILQSARDTLLPKLMSGDATISTSDQLILEASAA